MFSKRFRLPLAGLAIAFMLGIGMVAAPKSASADEFDGFRRFDHRPFAVDRFNRFHQPFFFNRFNAFHDPFFNPFFVNRFDRFDRPFFFNRFHPGFAPHDFRFEVKD